VQELHDRAAPSEQWTIHGVGRATDIGEVKETGKEWSCKTKMQHQVDPHVPHEKQ